TLAELRAAWRGVDDAPHVYAFLDMHDVGDALVRAGFADPVMDVDRRTLNYADARAVVRDLRALGARNAHRRRARGLTGRARFARFLAAYDALARDGRVPATVELVHGHAWAPRASTAGRPVIPIRART